MNLNSLLYFILSGYTIILGFLFLHQKYILTRGGTYFARQRQTFLELMEGDGLIQLLIDLPRLGILLRCSLVQLRCVIKFHFLIKTLEQSLDRKLSFLNKMQVSPELYSEEALTNARAALSTQCEEIIQMLVEYKTEYGFECKKLKYYQNILPLVNKPI